VATFSNRPNLLRACYAAVLIACTAVPSSAQFTQSAPEATTPAPEATTTPATETPPLTDVAPLVAVAAPEIAWQVENPFRFFTDPTDTEIHRATYRALSGDDKNNPVLAAERALEQRHNDGWAASMYRKTCWNWQANRFNCPAYDDYMNPKSHFVVARVANIEDAASLTCEWLTAPNGGSVVRGKVVTQPCDEFIELEAPYPRGLAVTVRIGGRDIAQTEIKVRDILVVGMGDSFASGEGNPDVPVRFSRDRTADYGKSGRAELGGYPARMGDWKLIGDPTFISENARWLDQACHRSLYSHQLRAALQLSVEDPHRSVTYAGVSCSGAEVTSGLFLRYKGNEWVPNPPVLSQISALAEAQCGKRDSVPMDLPEAYHINNKIPELVGGLVLRKCPKDAARKIDLVLLSIGGNDIGFSRLVANTILSNESKLRQIGGWFGEIHGQDQASQQMTRLDARYKSLNRALRNILYMPYDQGDRVILTGYPPLVLSGDGTDTCSDSRAGMEVVSDFQLSQEKARESTWVADKLHRQMRATADREGWTYAETHRRLFVDRGVCAGSEDDGGKPADDLRLPRKVDGAWKPYNPADFRAYASRQRWFRTPNDAFMTGNFHVSASLLQKVLKFDSIASVQLLLASTYSGSFHPTAEGQAAIADSVVQKARAVLEKYGQGPDRMQSVVFERLPAPVPEPNREMGPQPPQSSTTAAPPSPAQSSDVTTGSAPKPPLGPQSPVDDFPEVRIDRPVVRLPFNAPTESGATPRPDR
jgi:hypothetical protein